MEDVLEVYHRSFDDNEALVCLDEDYPDRDRIVLVMDNPYPVRGRL